MWKDLWKILSRGENLLDEARAESLQMLEQAREMYEAVTQAMREEVHQGVLDRIATMDRSLNRKEVDVRKKVFEHLAVSKGQDLLLGLVLVTVVIDIERIGDYTKNIGELVTFIPGRLDFGRFEERYESIEARTREMFDRTKSVFQAGDPETARKAIEFYDRISKDTDGMLKEIMETGAPSDSVEKRILGLALLLRYVKRVAAHLKNMCTAFSNPYPTIGFRPESGQ
jgi:phosphate transport system protein